MHNYLKLTPLLLLFLLIYCEKDSVTNGNPPDDGQDTTIVDSDTLTNDELLDFVQSETFKYFWDFGHPNSGMARERSDPNSYGGEGLNIVTSGGSGFGVMAILVGIERNWITRAEGLGRLIKITTFLLEGDRFHGAFPHWYYGDTGEVRPFSEKDNGGDLVETSYMIQGLLAARQYFNADNADEANLRETINTLWREVEWTWYTQGQDKLYWHWSPNYNFDMNMPITGYNEALITYVLAASSPTYPIADSVYHNGWTNSSHFMNGASYYNIVLPLGFSYGGPLFFSHYSFLGLDPRNLSDRYANYWVQNTHHTLINRSYCIDNPKGYIGYSSACWGLTASDNQDGYSAHSPTNDKGVITPTAALSSFPYTPEYSMDALKYFYSRKELWGEYGLYDAFNDTKKWISDNHLAIDQGPVIVMIENYRTQLIWNLFMSCPEVQEGLKKLEFNYEN